MTTVNWTENGTRRTALWRAGNGAPVPPGIVVVDDRLAASAALRLARSGSGLLWRGDFPNARQLMNAMSRRLPQRVSQESEPAEVFRAHRQARSERAALLGKVLIALEHDYSIRLPRAPDVTAACEHAFGQPADDRVSLVSLPELVGVIGAHEWHRKGIDIAALGARIHPSYGVFAPTRDEYVDLVAGVAFPQGVDHPVVFDIGTGTGVLAAILAKRGAREVVATDINPRAVRCARENMRRLGFSDRGRVAEADLWPGSQQRADLIVCNPPWLPGHPTSPLELGIYDPASDVLNRFLSELPQHLTPRGEGWLILSDLAEHLGLRTRDELLARIGDAGLVVAGRHETSPRHSRSTDSTDPLHAARSRERTVLWRLAQGGSSGQS
ncbi:methylase [Prauserella marina]|uniref:Methyltransferase small domain-containing protein n=1 Tax=Prauserella marina TaxID=530584 RepID=A0A222VTB0_9PSEU|nr:class I SAM-dependent methyltransferase [Prauserella marina]ASR36973.1 methylase [Prauserella marina]PWV80063.1 methyltransferase family protein [Prauserella marina]SDD84008.1 Methyltransferase small domain-containing protein [Prauserella marina]